MTLRILEQVSDPEEEVYDHDEEEHRHNYAENPSTLNKNTLIGKKLFEIYEKDPRPSVKRKKELAKSLNIPYAKLTTWFESRRAQDIKGLYLSIANIIYHTSKTKINNLRSSLNSEKCFISFIYINRRNFEVFLRNLNLSAKHLYLT